MGIPSRTAKETWFWLRPHREHSLPHSPSVIFPTWNSDGEALFVLLWGLPLHWTFASADPQWDSQHPLVPGKQLGAPPLCYIPYQHWSLEAILNGIPIGNLLLSCGCLCTWWLHGRCNVVFPKISRQFCFFKMYWILGTCSAADLQHSESTKKSSFPFQPILGNPQRYECATLQ